jgi:hypothetical protein
LSELRTGDGRELPLRLRREIEREFRRLELVLEQIDTIETEPRRVSRRLRSLRGWSDGKGKIIGSVCA